MRRYAGSTGRTAQGEWVFVDDLGLEVRVVGGRTLASDVA